MGRPYGGFPNLRFLDPFGSPAPYQLFVAALRHWVSVLRGHQVLIATDNTTVVFYINKQGGTHSLTLLRLVVHLFMWLQALDTVLRARHIPGCLNVIADCLSRPNQPISTRWSLHSESVNRIFQFWGTPMVHIFATVHNTRILQFMSPIPEPLANFLCSTKSFRNYVSPRKQK